MGRRANKHYPQLAAWARQYAKANDLVFHEYGAYHMRLIQDEVCCLDFWTTAKYYFKETNYSVYEARVIERAGETGSFSAGEQKHVETFFNKAFYPLDFI